MRRIALFDIDGTLLASGGAGRRAMEAALLEVFGSVGPEGYAYDGRTDKQIVRELMRGVGRRDDEIEAGMPRVFARYFAGLELEAQQGQIRPLPGVPSLLAALAERDDVVVGLLTGNVVEGAALKLGAAGIAMEQFVLGAYGSDHEHRPELPRIARERAQALLGEPVAPEALVVIGDTPLDVACAHAQGARAMAVATGRFTTRELAAHAPAVVVEDLSDVPRMIDLILSC